MTAQLLQQTRTALPSGEVGAKIYMDFDSAGADAIEQTHQTVWTTIGRAFYVQYFDGTRVVPVWTSAVPAIEPLCSDCA